MILRESEFSFLYFLFICAWLLEAKGWSGVLHSSKWQGCSFSRDQAKQDWKQVAGNWLMTAPFLYMWCFHVTLSRLCSFSNHLNYKINVESMGFGLYCESIFINNWETLMFRSPKAFLFGPSMGVCPTVCFKENCSDEKGGSGEDLIPWSLGLLTLSSDWSFLPEKSWNEKSSESLYSVRIGWFSSPCTS